MRKWWNNTSTLVVSIIVVVLLCVLLAGASVSAWYFSDRIAAHTYLGTLALGGLTRDQAAEKIQKTIDDFNDEGIHVVVEGKTEILLPETIGFDVNMGQALDLAFERGHSGSSATQLWQRLSALWNTTELNVPAHIDQAQLANELDDIATNSDTARKDIRLIVNGTDVRLLADTASGRVIDRQNATTLIEQSLTRFASDPIALTLVDDPPRADSTLALKAVDDARKMISRSLALQYEDSSFYISREKIGTWLRSGYEGPQLLAALDRESIGQYVTTVATKLNVAPIPPQITTDNGRVTGFVPPRVGRAVQEDELVDLIIKTITERKGKDKIGDTIVVPMKTSKMAITGLDGESGITELIGKATTPFTGSPKNRISNIKNGIKFLSGTIVPAGAEFSTLATLGVIDNTTGYLPELVIKGDRTTPEFGGGLCQVSTTLFRAVMNTGLPVTARRNHSYRVSYYEKDGDGRVIGPGLDATIYQPDLDFKFLNDTKYPILIIGYVIGDKATFELYGTKDGRTSVIVGPTILTQTAPGEPVYIETDTLAPGVIKQVETPHPGGSAVATYTVTYPDGTKKSQEFKSYYRRWPAKFLKGVAAVSITPTPTPTP